MRNFRLFLYDMIFLAGAVVLVAIVASLAHAQQVKSLWTQPGGLNTSEPGHSIPDNDFKDMGDVFTDNGAYVEKRGGLGTIYNIGKSYPVGQIYENVRINGTRYGIIKSSGELGYIDIDNTYKVLITTLSETSRLWMIQYNDKCYLGTSAKEDRWQFDPTATTTLLISSYIPCNKYPQIYYDKMFAINITTPLANDTQITTSGDESVIRYSRIGDLRSWDGDFWIGVNRNDGDTITGSAIYRGNLYVFKTNSTHQILRVENEDNTDGERAVQILANIGCISADTIKEVNGLLYWVSSKGVIEFDGTTYKIVSEDIRQELDTLIANDTIGLTSIIYDTANDFGLGSGVNIDTQSVAGSIIMRGDGLPVINQTADNISVNLSSNVVGAGVLSFPPASVYQSFTSSYTLQVATISVYVARHTLASTRNFILALYSNGYVFQNEYSASLISTTPGWYPINISTFNIVISSGVETYIVMRTTYDSLGTDNIYWMRAGNGIYDRGSNGRSDGSSRLFKMYMIPFLPQKTGIPIINQTCDKTPGGSFHINNSSDAYQSFMSSYTAILSTISVRLGVPSGAYSGISILLYDNNSICIASHTIAQNKVVSNGYTPVDFSTWSITLTRESTYYIKYNVASSTITGTYSIFANYAEAYSRGRSSAGGTIDFLFNVWTYPFYKSAIYQSYIKTIGNTFVQWDTINAEFTNEQGTNIKWYVSTTTDTLICNINNLIQVTTGQSIVSSSGTYVLWCSSLSSTDEFLTPSINNVNINYMTFGLGGASLYGYGDNFDLRYWVSGRSINSVINNIMYTYQQKIAKWTKHNMSVRSMTDFKGDFVMGTSLSNGRIYKYSDAYTTDDGTAISPYVQTKDFILSGRTNDSKINEIWYYLEPSTVYSTMTATYYPNLKDTAWSVSSEIGLNAVAGYSDMFIKKKVYVTGLDRVRSLGVRMVNFEKCYGLDIFFTPQPPGDR